MIKAVIFDMDGVLLDSEPLYFANHNRLFARYGFQLTLEQYKKYVGTKDVFMWRDLQSQFGEAVINESIEKLCHIGASSYLEFLREQKSVLQPIAGVVELLQVLRNDDYSIAIASSSHLPVIDEVVDTLGIRKYFDAIVSGDFVRCGKPAPDIFLLAAERLGVTANESVVIEDSCNGVKAGKAAGMRVIGYYNPNSGEQDLSKADIIIDCFADWNWQEQMAKFNQGV